MNRYSFNSEKHIHTLGGKALTGTSSVVGVLNKPGLVYWSSGKALELMGWIKTQSPKLDRLENASLVLEQIKEMGVKEYLQLLDKAYRNHKDSLDKSATTGTDMHSILELFIVAEMKRYASK